MPAADPGLGTFLGTAGATPSPCCGAVTTDEDDILRTLLFLDPPEEDPAALQDPERPPTPPSAVPPSVGSAGGRDAELEQRFITHRPLLLRLRVAGAAVAARVGSGKAVASGPTSVPGTIPGTVARTGLVTLLLPLLSSGEACRVSMRDASAAIRPGSGNSDMSTGEGAAESAPVSQGHAQTHDEDKEQEREGRHATQRLIVKNLHSRRSLGLYIEKTGEWDR